MLMAKFASRDKGLSLSWSWQQHKQMFSMSMYPPPVLMYTHTQKKGHYVRADRGVDCKLVCWGYLIVQRFGDGDDASGSVYGEERRGWLDGEENAASSALVWICGVHHEHWSAHRCVLQDTFVQTESHTQKLSAWISNTAIQEETVLMTSARLQRSLI